MDSFEKIYDAVMKSGKSAIKHHEEGYGAFVRGSRIRINISNKYDYTNGNASKYTTIRIFDMYDQFTYPEGRDVTNHFSVEQRHAMLVHVEEYRKENLTDWIDMMFEVNDE